MFTHGYIYTMDELKNYLNSLPVEQQDQYAKSCGTTLNYLRKAISKGNVKFDGALCRLLDENSGGKVPRTTLRPDIWPTNSGPYVSERRRQPGRRETDTKIGRRTRKPAQP